MKLKVTKVDRHTPDAVSIYFKQPFFSKIHYKAGQFLTVCFTIDGREEKRAYSFSSSPFTDSFLRITVKRVKDGLVSNYINDNIKPGDKVKVEKPMGNFYIEPEATQKRNIVLFGGGSGITPMLSIAKSILDQELNSSVLLFYANRDENSIIFKEEIAALEDRYPEKFKVVHVLESMPQPYGNLSFEGYIRNEIVQQILASEGIKFNQGFYFLCGPAPYMDQCKEILKSNDAPKSRIKMEAFTAPVRTSVSAKDFKSSVTIKKNGTWVESVNVKGTKTILQGGLLNNLDMPYSCRSGMCSTCKARCVEGEVSMPDGHFLTDEEVAEGYILTCIGSPRTEKVTIEIP